MGKKGSWFSAVKKVFSPNSKKDKKSHKSEKQTSANVLKLASEEAPVTVEDVKLIEADNEHNKHAFSLAFATAVAAEAAEAAAEVVRLTSTSHHPGKSREEIAAIKIQTVFRGYMARRALRALRGLVRLKTLTQGQSVKSQAATTLRCMHTLARLQSQIRERRIRMSEENQALRQLQKKHEKELEKLRATQVGDEWDDSLQSKEQTEAKLLHKQEAALRRERALAYSFSHQKTWKNSSKSVNPTFMDPNNPHWGWSWLERWMASRPLEGESTKGHQTDHASIKSETMSVGESTKLYSLCDSNHDTKFSPFGQKARRRPNGKEGPSSSKGSAWGAVDDDLRSTFSVERYRRHSIGGSSSVRDDESLASSPAIPSYMVPTSSAKARSIILRPSLEKGGAAAKKRLSFSPSPVGSRRHSGPPKLEMLYDKEVVTVSNGKGR